MSRALLVLVFLLSAAVARGDEAVPAAIKDKLAGRLPNVALDKLRRSETLPGWYEIEHGLQLYYISPDAKRLVLGDIVDLETKTNLTEAWREHVAIQAINAVGEQNMIVMGPETAKRTITVFTDVDCPYCAKLHKEVPELNKNGVKVRYLFFPRAGIPSDTYKRSVAVWCAADRVKAVGIAKSGGALDMKTCANPVESHYKLGQQLEVNGTPTIYLDDGKMLGGYVPSAQLLAILNVKPPLKTSDVR
jgi:thiol:disulfide interchange protein DsbC